MRRTLLRILFMAVTLTTTQASHAQAIASIENPCGCVWRDAKTGEPVGSGPFMTVNPFPGRGEPYYRGILPDAADPSTAFDPQTGRNFFKVPCPKKTVMTPQQESPNSPPSSAQGSHPQSTTGATPRSPQTSMSPLGSGIQFQLRGIGGASFVKGNAPATSGFDGGVFFPLGNRVMVGPSAGFQWINSSIVHSIGSHQTGSTFIDTSAGFKNGNIGGTIGFPFGGFQLGIQGGATVANSTITQQSGFCGPNTTNPTAPPGCTVFSTTTTHDTVVGPFVGGYISHSIFSHVGVFAGYDYNRLKITLPSSGSSSSTSTRFDLNRNTVEAGFTFYVGDLLKH